MAGRKVGSEGLRRRNYPRGRITRRPKCIRTSTRTEVTRRGSVVTDLPTSDLLGLVLSQSGLGNTCGGMGSGQKANKISEVDMSRLLPCLQRRHLSLLRRVQGKGCGPRPIHQIRVPGRRGKGFQGLKVPAIMSHVVRRTVARILIPVCRPRFSSDDFKFHPGQNTRSTLGRYRTCTSRNCICIMSVSLRGFFSGIYRDGLVRILSEDMGSNQIVSLVRRCLRTNIVQRKVFRQDRRKIPRKKPLDPLLDGVVLGRLSGRLRQHKRGFIHCTSSYVVLYGDEEDTREALRDVAQCVRGGLFLGIGQGGARMTRVHCIGCLKCNFCQGGKGYQLQIRPGSVAGVGSHLQFVLGQDGKGKGRIETLLLGQFVGK